jgi:hypothetical protein
MLRSEYITFFVVLILTALVSEVATQFVEEAREAARVGIR